MLDLGYPFYQHDIANSLTLRFLATTNDTLSTFSSSDLKVAARPATCFTYMNASYWDYFGCGNYYASTRIYTPAQLQLEVVGLVLTGTSGSNNLYTTSFSTWYNTGLEVFFNNGGGMRGVIRFCSDSPVFFSPESTIANTGCTTVSADTTRFIFQCNVGASISAAGGIQLSITNVQAPMDNKEPAIPGYCLMIYLTTRSTTGTPTTVATSLADPIIANMHTLSYTYTPSSLVLTPEATNYAQVVSTFAGTFAIMTGQALSSGSLLAFTVALTSFDFSSATVSGGTCAIATQVSDKLTIKLTASANVGSIIYCSVANLRVVFANTDSRVSANDPYIINKDALILTSPAITTGVSASANIVIRAINTAAYWWHMSPSDRSLVRGSVLSATRAINVGLRVYLYATNPNSAVISYTVISSCSDILIVTPSNSVTPTGDFRVTQDTTFSITFDVTNTARYLLDLSCFSMGSITRAIGAVQPVSEYSRHFDFLFYPVRATLQSGINLSGMTHGAAFVDLEYEVIVYAHKTLAAGWGFTLTLQGDLASRSAFASSTTATPTSLFTASSGLTQIDCTVTYSTAAAVSASDCSNVSGSSNYYAPRVFRFGPVTSTYANYLSLFKTYNVSEGAVTTASGVSASQQNTDMSDDTIDATISKPSAVAALYSTKSRLRPLRMPSHSHQRSRAHRDKTTLSVCFSLNASQLQLSSTATAHRRAWSPRARQV